MNVTGSLPEIKGDQYQLPGLVYIETDPVLNQMLVAEGFDYLIKELSACGTVYLRRKYRTRGLPRPRRGVQVAPHATARNYGLVVTEPFWGAAHDYGCELGSIEPRHRVEGREIPVGQEPRVPTVNRSTSEISDTT